MNDYLYTMDKDGSNIAQLMPATSKNPQIYDYFIYMADGNKIIMYYDTGKRFSEVLDFSSETYGGELEGYFVSDGVLVCWGYNGQFNCAEFLTYDIDNRVINQLEEPMSRMTAVNEDDEFFYIFYDNGDSIRKIPKKYAHADNDYFSNSELLFPDSELTHGREVYIINGYLYTFDKDGVVTKYRL